ncbi:CRISPR-associated endonuclease Cas2 [Leptotrichia sp. HSP-536]|uniref:CRISPR-associated endonuclease Cas2 n=1 Tax=Leptotrichia alba TaxID=3239304 RepID=A0AB39V6V9_9FUSO
MFDIYTIFVMNFLKTPFTIIVIYDIIDNKRRAFLKKLLNSFGNRIQRLDF